MKPFLRRSLPFLIGGMALTLALYFTLFNPETSSQASPTAAL